MSIAVSENMKVLETLGQQESAPDRFDAVLLIDVQSRYCSRLEGGTVETESIAHRIGGLAPQFRQAAAPVYAIYYRHPGLSRGKVDFFGFRPEGDTVIGKDTTSAFEGAELKGSLQKGGFRTLLVMGFNQSACVYATVRDPLGEGYRVWVAADCTADDLFTQMELANERIDAGDRLVDLFGRGARFISADDALAVCRSRTRRRPEAGLAGGWSRLRSVLSSVPGLGAG
ncbi:MAG: cysteine hydrolase [Alphaproteobacteria bacterium]|nr:cysteine hydrolase [Alphaproteobacteria bacterium]